ncbi:MAG: Lrp/AsnC family transcriptional regulator [Candidatus Methanomethylicota archaeon]|uniref:Lrp/AsnC family transcriptional regulator n=1 Tax=Thermoproteota archaeon TaxID=2056631 RepID=A0A497F040_9CREN|nr:MAG: Lrp/AsnC family transcriptional regulator [Candidatus Verstraetearchaeota archaeon]
MALAYVLINAETGTEGELLDELMRIEGVEEAYIVYGVYDIITKIRAEDMDKLKEIISWRIRRLPKVRSTLTMMVVESENK